MFEVWVGLVVLSLYRMLLVTPSSSLLRPLRECTTDMVGGVLICRIVGGVFAGCGSIVDWWSG